MLCYKDRTYCRFYKVCRDGKDCSQALKPEIEKAASMTHYRICQFATKPDCFVPIVIEKQLELELN